MPRFCNSLMLSLASAGLLICSMPLAEAKDLRSAADSDTTLTVKRRNFLDSGKVVPVGSLKNYATQGTTLNQPVYQTFAPDSFGNSTLPTRFSGNGRARSLIEF